jgi:predicted RNase H-like nuclease
VLLAGLDLAWQPSRNGSGLAVGRLGSGRLEITSLHSGLVGLDAVLAQLPVDGGLRGVAIDAPLLINNKSGQRECERSLNRVYRPFWAGCHPANLSRYPDAPSVAVSRALREQGFELLGPPDAGRWQVECYPHPALVELFDLPRRLAYKKGSAAQRREGQVRLAALLHGLGRHPTLSLHIPPVEHHYLDTFRIRRLRGRSLKDNEDALDAIICLYIAGLYQLGAPMRVFGDVGDGFIVVPDRSRAAP